MDTLLDVKDLQITFQKEKKNVKIIDGVSFSVHAGETLGIVGESGCGKSVTSLSIMGLLPKGNARIEQGSIKFDQMELSTIEEEHFYKLRGKDIAMIFQDPMTSLNPVFTIGDQLMEVIFEHTSMNKKKAFEHAVKMLTKVGIARAKEVMAEYPHQLSGGMRQRVMIAMAMLLNPKLLIADEPTTALDVTIQAQILDLMKGLKNEFNTAIIMITHDLGVVAEVCERVVVMYAGQIVEEGDVRSIFHSPKHPYTVGLMRSIPHLSSEQDRLYSIQGTVPAPEEMPEGCRFAPRCEQAKAQCFQTPPRLIEISENHKTSCWLYA